MDLAALGIDADQERAYRDLVAHGPADAGELAERLRLPVDTTVELLNRLVEAGLVGPDGHRHLAFPPDLVLRARLVRRRTELGRAESALTELSAAFRSSANQRNDDVVEVVTDADGVRQRFIQLQNGALHDVRVFVRHPPSVVTGEENEAEPRAVARGVRYRVVMERAALAAPGGWSAAEAAQESGEEVRVVTTLPLRVMIVDDDVGMVPLTRAGRPGAIVVRGCGLLDALVALFELVWERGTPLTPAVATGKLGALDDRIVALLLQGFTDRAIAGQLKISPRTVQRRIRHLMDAAQVGTRVQLGYRLAGGGLEG